MKKVLLIMAEGLEEIEAVTPVDVLRRAGIDVTTAGLDSTGVTGAHGIGLQADTTLEATAAGGYDMLVLPGGGPGTGRLAASPKVIELVQKFYTANKYVAAICAAPTVLVKAGIANGHDLTSYPGMESNFDPGNYKTEKVVVSKNIITSRGPGTAMEFSLKLIEVLTGKEMSDKIRTELVY